MLSSSFAPIEAASGVHTPPLRICVMTDCAHGIGGMQRHTHDLVRGLERVGHEIEVICPADDSLDREAYGARWHLVDTPGRTDKRWREKFRATFVAADRERAFDVVHSESTAAHGLLLKPAVTTPIVLKYHGNYVGLAKAHLQRALQRPTSAPREARRLAYVTRRQFSGSNIWAFRGCESIVASGQQLRDTSRSHLIPLQQLHVVPNGVDVAQFAPGDRATTRRTLGLANGPLVVTVGRLNREKGFDVAIGALVQLKQERSDVRLVIVGEGEERFRLEELVRQRDVERHADFVGGQPADKVVQYLIAADVFVCPTRRDEAGPIVVTEAMACGSAVIASKIGGVPEMFDREGQPAGVLVPPGDIGALATWTHRLLGNDPLRIALGERARRRVVEEYTIETMVDRTVTVYRRALSRTTSRVTWSGRARSAGSQGRSQ